MCGFDIYAIREEKQIGFGGVCQNFLHLHFESIAEGEGHAFYLVGQAELERALESIAQGKEKVPFLDETDRDVFEQFVSNLRRELEELRVIVVHASW